MTVRAVDLRPDLRDVVGIPLGIISASDATRSVDVVTMGFANLGVSIPVFVLGLLLAFVFAILLKDTPFALPPSGRLSPACRSCPLADALGPGGPPGTRCGPSLDFVSNMYTFNALLSAQWAVLRRRLPAPDPAGHRAGHDPARDHRPHHPLEPARRPGPRLRPDRPGQGPQRARAWCAGTRCRNAMLPVVTIIGLQVGGLLSGAVLTETIFNLAGVGKAVYEAIHVARLRGHPGLHAGDRDRLPGRQPARRLSATRYLDPRVRPSDEATAA